jgi:hypothetical protein
VLADEGAALAERLDRAVEDDGVVGQLAAALAGVGQQVPKPPSTSNALSRSVAPVRRDSA